MFLLMGIFAQAIVAFSDRPGDGMPLVQMHPGYSLTNLRPSGFAPGIGGIEWLSGGRMVVLDWGKHEEIKGAVYILEGTQLSPPKVTFKKFAEGFKEPLGLAVVNDTIHVLDMRKLVKLIDKDKDGIAEQQVTVVEGWPYGGTFHEFAMGLAFRNDAFYFNTAMAVVPGGKPMIPQPVANRGMHMKVSRTGEIEYIAGGLRTPNGLAFNEQGETFVTDNQGGYLPSSKVIHVKPGRFYGHHAVPPNTFDSRPESPPALWLPQGEIAFSPSQPVFVPAGEFKDQMLFGDIHYGGIQRAFLEKIEGEYQGAAFRFLAGLEAGVNRLLWGKDGSLYAAGIGTCGVWSFNCTQSGLQRIQPNGTVAFEMKSVRSRSKGFEIEFTEPVGMEAGSAAAFAVKTWWYKPTVDYGGPKMEPRTLEITSVRVSQDRRSVYLEIAGLKTGHVVHIRSSGVLNTSGKQLWSTEAWYTLNAIGQSEPFTHPSILSERPADPTGGIGIALGPGGNRILMTVPSGGHWQLQLRSVDGALRHSSMHAGGSASISTGGFGPPGVYFLQVRTQWGTAGRRLVLPGKP